MKKSIKRALQHPDKLGEGAKKRKKLDPTDRIEAAVREYEKGTLHSGSGKKVKNKKQALAIGYSEARK